MANNDFIEDNWKQDDRGRQFRIVICFRTHESPRAFECELFPIARINQNVLLALNYKTLKLL